jgi:hypothetical protein
MYNHRAWNIKQLYSSDTLCETSVALETLPLPWKVRLRRSALCLATCRFKRLASNISVYNCYDRTSTTHKMFLGCIRTIDRHVFLESTNLACIVERYSWKHWNGRHNESQLVWAMFASKPTKIILHPSQNISIDIQWKSQIQMARTWLSKSTCCERRTKSGENDVSSLREPLLWNESSSTIKSWYVSIRY